jgi:hypothetical protein
VGAAIFSGVHLVLLFEAANVALFADDKRAERALKVLRELLNCSGSSAGRRRERPLPVGTSASGPAVRLPGRTA